MRCKKGAKASVVESRVKAVVVAVVSSGVAILVRSKGFVFK